MHLYNYVYVPWGFVMYYVMYDKKEMKRIIRAKQHFFVRRLKLIIETLMYKRNTIKPQCQRLKSDIRRNNFLLFNPKINKIVYDFSPDNWRIFEYN